MHNVITLPIWLMGDHAEVILRALLAPLSDPRGWSDSMGCRAFWLRSGRGAGGAPPRGTENFYRSRLREPPLAHAYIAPPHFPKTPW